MIFRSLALTIVGLVISNPLWAQVPNFDSTRELLRITINQEDFEKVLQGSNLDFSNHNNVKFFLGSKELTEAEYLKVAGEGGIAEEALAHQRRLSGIFWTGVGALGLGIVLSTTGGNDQNGNPSATSGFGFTLVLGSLVPLFWGQYNKTRFNVYQLWKIGQRANESKLKQNQTLNSEDSII